MKLIGAGFGRTGTMSIKKALEQLGCGPCYHMKIALFRYDHLRFFLRAWRGKKVNWKRFYRRYNSAVDWPTCSFYKQLMAEYPDARVLLNVREPEDWYDSMKETINTIVPVFPWWFPRIMTTIHDEIIWNGNLQGAFNDREKTIEVYKAWIEEVKAAVPPEKLLVFNVKEGWKPLCDFLGVPVPEDRPFPKKNDRKSFKRIIWWLKLANWLVPVIALIMLFLLFFLIR
jgi:hypothetical protein